MRHPRRRPVDDPDSRAVPEQVARIEIVMAERAPRIACEDQRAPLDLLVERHPPTRKLRAPRFLAPQLECVRRRVELLDTDRRDGVQPRELADGARDRTV